MIGGAIAMLISIYMRNIEMLIDEIKSLGLG